jgi:hypothetical protein
MNTADHDQLLEFQSDHQWIEQNRLGLLARYSNQWIAVRSGHVLASDPDLDALLGRLPDPAHTCVEFLGREPIEMVL